MIELHIALLLVALIPMLGAATFKVLAFHKLGYGRIGKSISIGYMLLVGSLVFVIITEALGDTSIETEPIADVLRALGWTGLCIGAVLFYIEVGRSLP